MKLRSNYTQSRWYRLSQWLHGEYDPFEGKLEMKRPEEQKAPAGPDPTRVNHEKVRRAVEDWSHNREMRAFRRLYQIASLVLCIMLIFVLLLTVANMPAFGSPDAPAHNEVMARYLEKGMAETGTVNAVTGMILGYRAFDTFGETCVLFIASCCVMILLLADDSRPASKEDTDLRYEPSYDLILRKIAFILTPLVFLFGLYIILNGHLSPGGGFSGGAMIGAGLILYVGAFGVDKTRRFFNHTVYQRVKVGSLVLYGLTMSYYFFTGGNHLGNPIPLGTPGNILSSGMILPINMYVGLEVACTMYAFYAMFRRGEL